MRAVETENVSYLQPIGFGWRPTEPSDRLGELLLAVHPSAQFLSFVLMHNSHLVFATVLVRHAISPQSYVAFAWSLALMDSSLPWDDGSTGRRSDRPHCGPPHFMQR